VSSVIDFLDQSLKRLEQGGRSPVTIVLDRDRYQQLALIGDWPVSSSQGLLRFRSTPVYEGRQGEPTSIVGRAASGETARIVFE
jgi:hypothetical protein